MSDSSAHLVERAAQRLRRASGLIDDEAVHDSPPAPSNGVAAFESQPDTAPSEDEARPVLPGKPPLDQAPVDAVSLGTGITSDRPGDNAASAADGPPKPRGASAHPLADKLVGLISDGESRPDARAAAAPDSIERLADPANTASAPPDGPSRNGLRDAASPAPVAGGLRPLPGVKTDYGPQPAPSTKTIRRAIDAATLERAGLLARTRSKLTEELRIAVAQILRAAHGAFNAGHPAANLIMVTSSRPGEGKSFLSLNLAGSIASQSQREVLLVDADAKVRPLSHELGVADMPGMLDLAREPTMRIEDAVVSTAIPALSVLPIGSRRPDDADIPSFRPISAIVERVGRRFANRLVVLDTPPCLSTSDPSEFAPIVGQIVMIVEAERTQRHELEAALDLVGTCPTITLLLNKVQRSSSYTFGAYHYFGTYS